MQKIFEDPCKHMNSCNTNGTIEHIQYDVIAKFKKIVLPNLWSKLRMGEHCLDEYLFVGIAITVRVQNLHLIEVSFGSFYIVISCV